MAMCGANNNTDIYTYMRHKLAYHLLYPSAWADQKATRVDNLVIPQLAGWITSYPPVVHSYVMQT